jgi:hypothetical protein
MHYRFSFYTIAVVYQVANLSLGVSEDALGLYAWNGQARVKEPTGAVDAGANLVTATLGHPSTWAVRAEVRVYLRFVVSE